MFEQRRAIRNFDGCWSHTPVKSINQRPERWHVIPRNRWRSNSSIGRTVHRKNPMCQKQKKESRKESRKGIQERNPPQNKTKQTQRKGIQERNPPQNKTKQTQRKGIHRRTKQNNKTTKQSRNKRIPRICDLFFHHER